MKFGPYVSLYTGKLFGYSFLYLNSPEKQQAFMEEFKKAVPLKMWDPSTKLWWVPDIYCTIAESVGLQHGALQKSMLKLVAGYRATYMHGEKTLADDLKTLGLQPNAPLKLAEMAYFYWRGTLSAQPISILEAQAIEDAWQRISAHFAAEAERDPVVPSRLPVMT